MDNENIKEIETSINTEENIVRYLNFGVQNRRLIISITSIFTISALVFALLSDKYYVAKVTMIETDGTNSGLSAFNNVTEGFGGLTSILGGFESEDSNTIKALAVLESRTFIEEFIDENKILPILFSHEWDDETQSSKDESKDLFDGYMEFKDIISVEKDNKTNIFSISVEWKDPLESANWANLLFRKINKVMSQKDKESAKKNIVYLESQLNESEKVGIQNTLHAMIEQQTKTEMLASAQEEYVFESLDLAVVPKERSKPQRRLIVLAGLFIGLILSIAFIFVKEYIIYIKRIYSSRNK